MDLEGVQEYGHCVWTLTLMRKIQRHAKLKGLKTGEEMRPARVTSKGMWKWL